MLPPFIFPLTHITNINSIPSFFFHILSQPKHHPPIIQKSYLHSSIQFPIFSPFNINFNFLNQNIQNLLSKIITFFFEMQGILGQLSRIKLSPYSLELDFTHGVLCPTTRGPKIFCWLEDLKLRPRVSKPPSLS